MALVTFAETKVTGRAGAGARLIKYLKNTNLLGTLRFAQPTLKPSAGHGQTKNYSGRI